MTQVQTLHSDRWLALENTEIPYSLEQCAYQLHCLMRHSYRDWDRCVEILRAFEYAREAQAAADHAATYRTILPVILQVATAAFAATSVVVAISPTLVKRGVDLISKAAQTKTAEEIAKTSMQVLTSGTEMCKAGRDITGNYDAADRVRAEATDRQARELAERRAREADERHRASADSLQAIQQGAHEEGETFRAVASRM